MEGDTIGFPALESLDLLFGRHSQLYRIGQRGEGFRSNVHESGFFPQGFLGFFCFGVDPFDHLMAVQYPLPVMGRPLGEAVEFDHAAIQGEQGRGIF